MGAGVGSTFDGAALDWGAAMLQHLGRVCLSVCLSCDLVEAHSSVCRRVSSPFLYIEIWGAVQIYMRCTLAHRQKIRNSAPALGASCRGCAVSDVFVLSFARA